MLGIITQSRQNYPQWIKKFTIAIGNEENKLMRIKDKEGNDKVCFFESMLVSSFPLDQGWATSLIGGPLCRKKKSFPGRIIRWIEFNIFNNYYCHGRSDCKGKKRSYTSSDILFFTENKQKKAYSLHVLRCPVFHRNYR